MDKNKVEAILSCQNKCGLVGTKSLDFILQIYFWGEKFNKSIQNTIPSGIIVIFDNLES
jgi:NADPH-dependent curcumin reductase CurA